MGGAGNPIAEAFVRLRPDVRTLRTETQAGIRQALSGVSVPSSFGQDVGRQLFGQPFRDRARTEITGGVANVDFNDQTQRGLAQRLFGPGFRDETGRAIQGALVGLGGGQLAAQFAFFGPGGAALAVMGAGLVTAAQSAATLDQQLEILQATTQASEADIERFAEAAEQLGNDMRLPGITAQDAARAMTELAKAGLNVEDSIDGARGVLELAIAGEVGIGDAARIAASGLNAFDLAGTEASRVADLLAGASIAAQGDIGDMALALQQSAAVADQAGLSIEQLVGLITELAKQGILGSDAGTSIRTMLLRLIPTTAEAAKFMAALGVSIDETRTLGEQFPDVIDQYRSSLAKLPPVLQQATLQQIFGTDAIRAATVVFGEGSKELDNIIAQVSQTGSASQLAEARTEGLSGAFSEFVGNVQDASREIGQALSPGLETYLDITNAVIGSTREASEAIENLTPAQELIRNADVQNLQDAVDLLFVLEDRIREVGTNEVAEEAFTRLTERLRRANLGADELAALFAQRSEEIARALEDGIITPLERVELAADEVGELFLQTFDPELPDQTFSRVENRLAQTADEARDKGQDAGRAFGQGFQSGIDAEEARTIAAARRQLQSIREEADRQLTAAIRDARSNLEAVGSSLTDAVGDIIDLGPIGDRIAELQERLDALQESVSRRQLRFDVTEAKRDLEDARDALIQIGVPTEEQKRENREFLDPFIQKVEDAKARVQEFTLQEAIDEQERLKEAAKDAAEEGIAALIAGFQDGKTSADQFATLLRRQLGPALDTVARENLGLTLERDFLRDVEALVEQARELSGFLGRPGTEPGPRVVSPRDAQVQGQERVIEAQRDVAEAIREAKKQATSDTESTNAILRQIREAVSGRGNLSGRR